MKYRTLLWPACLVVLMLASASPVLGQTQIDLNSDGVDDILLQDQNTKNVSAWLMNEDGQPTEFVSVWDFSDGGWTVSYAQCGPGGGTPIGPDSGPWRVVGAIDLNADGVDDILLQSPNNAVMGWLMNGTGQPASHVLVRAPGLLTSSEPIYCYMDTRWTLVATADLDGDGGKDLIYQTPDDPNHPPAFRQGVRVDRRDAAGHSVGTQPLYIATYDMGGWKVVGAADMNNDGIIDVILQHPSGFVAAWLTDGTGFPETFVWVWPYENDGWKVVGTQDLNKDGVVDILLQHTGGYVGAWLMDAAGQPATFEFIWPYDNGPWRVNGQLR